MGLSTEKNESRPILFFDGVCGLCNRAVNWLFKVDTHGRFLVATLQGKTAQEKLDRRHVESMSSLVVFTRDGKTKTQSEAVRYILRELGGVWKMLYLLTFWVPTGMADACYRFVAQRRYVWFGKWSHCRLPTPAELERFLE